MSANTVTTIGSAYSIELDYTNGLGVDANVDNSLLAALKSNFSVASDGTLSATSASANVSAFFNEILNGNAGDDFNGDHDLRFFLRSNLQMSDIVSEVQLLYDGNASLQNSDKTDFATGPLSGTEITKNFFERLAADDSIYATVFDLNAMADMSRVPADNYAIALEELRAIGTNNNMGIAELTQATTDVQVESGKLEMINGVVKNAVNYLNTRARALTS